MNLTSGWINYNGSFFRSETPLLPVANRAFRYGDGLFETMLVRDGQIALALYHFDRLFYGLDLLQFTIPPSFNRQALERQVLELCERNGNPPRSRVRLVAFRGDGGLFDPVNPHPQYVIESWPLPAGSAGLNAKGLVIDIFPHGRKACDGLANLKSNNYLLYVLAALYAQKQGLDDCLVLNSQDKLADSAIANLFFVQQGQCYTPPLSEGCVAGVMRRYLLEHMPAAGFPVLEKAVTPEELLAADEVFLTNALKGIRWVASYRQASYTNIFTTALYKKLLG